MSQRRVLITGAGSGLGQALALRYAARGDRVACVDVRADRAADTVARLSGDGHLALTADVGSDDAMTALQDAVVQQWGDVDVLINNAGIPSGGPMVGTTMREWRDVLEINLLGVVRGCRAFLPAMLARGRGHVINVASFAGLAGAPNMMSYGVSKAAVVALSEQLRAEVRGRGVQVSVICPSFFRTNLLDNFCGDERIRHAAGRMMQGSSDTLDAVADRCVAAAERGVFMILPTRQEPLRWRLKRWLPEYFAKKVAQLAPKAGG